MTTLATPSFIRDRPTSSPDVSRSQARRLNLLPKSAGHTFNALQSQVPFHRPRSISNRDPRISAFLRVVVGDVVGRCLGLHRSSASAPSSAVFTALCLSQSHSRIEGDRGVGKVSRAQRISYREIGEIKHVRVR